MGPHKYKKIPKITIIAKNNAKNKSRERHWQILLKESREWGLTNITKIPKITIIPKMAKITNQRNDSGEYNKPLGPVSDAELFMC